MRFQERKGWTESAACRAKLQFLCEPVVRSLLHVVEPVYVTAEPGPGTSILIWRGTDRVLLQVLLHAKLEYGPDPFPAVSRVTLEF
ncbi:MAG: hypothetical protein ACLQU4_01955 [Limisphaerales bacterium]